MSLFPDPPLVIVESPFRATDVYSTAQHRAYLKAALADCFLRGEAPFASHHLIPEVLDDDTPYERGIGIRCGLVWGQHAAFVACYSDFGLSPGMRQALAHYKQIGKRIEWRTLEYSRGGSATLRAIREMANPHA